MTEKEPGISTIDRRKSSMNRALRHMRMFKRTWDSDKAIKSTYKGLFGNYQLRAYLLIALGYGIVAAWVAEMPTFALLPPKYIDCTPYYPNLTNQTSIGLNGTTARVSNLNLRTNLVDGYIRNVEPVYNYSREYGRSVLTDLNVLCDKSRIRIPYIAYILGFILGGLVLGYLADHSGRKMVLLGSLWTTCIISVFQLLSEDYISYVFFIFFLGVTIGAIHVVAIPYVIEMFSIESRAIYGLSLLGIVFLLSLIIPWLALWIKNWKILQGVVTVPLIFTAALYWFTDESMFWYTAQKDYYTAVLSLTEIARFNGVVFEDKFGEAREFLQGKHSKEVQCDFQPLLRLEDIRTLGTKYPDFDMVDLQATSGKKSSLSQRILQVITGHHYNPTTSIFYPTDILHSQTLAVYLLVMCGLWLVSSLTEYSLDVQHLTQHLTEDFYFNYFYTHLIQVVSFIVALPMVYLWGRRWPTFCFFLIAEVCLLGSVAVKLDDGQLRSAMLIVYFMGKFATRAAFIVIIIYTCEIFPTGLRCTALGICYTFRLIGVALASPDVGEVNGWMPRLIYGILSLILGAMALLLPETKKMPLPRTMMTVERIPTSISTHFRRRRSRPAKKISPSDKSLPDGANASNDANSLVSGPRTGRGYDFQSTIHSVYELEELGQDDTIQSTSTRYPSRRMDLRNPTFYQSYSNSGINNEIHRQPHIIVEDVEYTDEDMDDDRTRLGPQRRLSEQQRLALQRRLSEQERMDATQNPVTHTDDDAIIMPTNTRKVSANRESPSDAPSQLEITAQIQSGDLTGDRSILTTATDDTKDDTDRNRDRSQSPKYQRTMSQDENYFSEHC